MLPAALLLFYQKSEQTQTCNSLFMSYKDWQSLSLSASPHFLFSIILFVVLWILSSTAHTLFFCNFLCSLSRPPASLSLTPSSLPPASNRPILYELQLKMMSLIIWEEIMWLSFSLSLWFCGAMCACSRLTVCTCTLVYVGVHCVAHIIICRHEWKTSMWAICWLNLWPTAIFFTDSGQKRKLSCLIIGRNRTLLALPAGMWKRRDKIHVSLLNQRHFLRSEKNRVLVLGSVQTRLECEDGWEEG